MSDVFQCEYCGDAIPKDQSQSFKCACDVRATPKLDHAVALLGADALEVPSDCLEGIRLNALLDALKEIRDILREGK